LFFLDFGDQYLEDLMDAAMKEDLELVKLGLSQGPQFSTPEEEIHRDCWEEFVFVMYIKVRILPYFLQ
jgi:hypothetical protein